MNAIDADRVMYQISGALRKLDASDWFFVVARITASGLAILPEEQRAEALALFNAVLRHTLEEFEAQSGSQPPAGHA